jgi:hypothetical protein
MRSSPKRCRSRSRSDAEADAECHHVTWHRLPSRREARALGRVCGRDGLAWRWAHAAMREATRLQFRDRGEMLHNSIRDLHLRPRRQNRPRTSRFCRHVNMATVEVAPGRGGGSTAERSRTKCDWCRQRKCKVSYRVQARPFAVLWSKLMAHLPQVLSKRPRLVQGTEMLLVRETRAAVRAERAFQWIVVADQRRPSRPMAADDPRSPSFLSSRSTATDASRQSQQRC